MALESGTYIEDLVITNPASSDPRSEGDDHFRLIKTLLKNTFPGMAGAMSRVQTKSGAYTVVKNDNTSLIDCSAALTLSMTAAATLGSAFLCYVYARGGDVTIDPNGSENINGGSASLVLKKGYAAVIFCTGSELFLFRFNTMRGLQSSWIQAGGWIPRLTDGASGPNVYELTTNKINLRVLEFPDGAAAKYAQFPIKAPKSWDLLTISGSLVWTGQSGSGAVRWGLRAVAAGDDDALDVAMGTAQEVTDTFIANNDCHITTDFPAITVANSPASRDLITLEVYRDPTNGADTYNGTALMIGTELKIAFSAPDDE